AVLLTGSLAGGAALALVGEARSRATKAEADVHLARAAVRAAADAEIKDRLEQQLYVQRVALAERELAARHIVRALELLAECPGKLRGWEWNALHHLCHADPLVLKGHTAAVSAVVYRPDGRRLVSAGHDRTLV